MFHFIIPTLSVGSIRAPPLEPRDQGVKMVKQDKNNDILDFLLGSGVDLGEILTPDTELFPMARFESLDQIDPAWQRPEFITEFQEIGENMANDDGVAPEIKVDFLANDVEIASDVAIETEEVIVPDSDQLYPSESTTNEMYSTTDDSLATSCTVVSFEDLTAESDLVFEEVQENDYVSDIDLSPLVKEDLKFKIRTRRLAEGKDDIEVVFREPSPERLTEEEEERRKVKREKNKLAAQKCRQKKRKLAETLEEQTYRLEEKQEKLQDEIQRLRDERDQLRELIKVHRAFCPKLAKK